MDVFAGGAYGWNPAGAVVHAEVDFAPDRIGGGAGFEGGFVASGDFEQGQSRTGREGNFRGCFGFAGGANGKFKMGRRLKMAADCPSTDMWCDSKPTYTPTTNSKILVSIAQAFEQEVNSFGTQPIKANVTGALSEMMT